MVVTTAAECLASPERRMTVTHMATAPRTFAAKIGGVSIEARGPLSEAVLSVLGAAEGDDEQAVECLSGLVRQAVSVEDPVRDDDIQLALFLMYAISYGSLDQVGAQWEWDPRLIVARTAIERVCESALRAQISMPDTPRARATDVAEALFDMTRPTPGPNLARFIARQADVAQAREYLALHSIYTLREADAHSWTIPRLTGRTKAAMLEIQADEYGGGDPQRVHQVMYGRTLRGAGLDDAYGRYVDAAPAITLAAFNVMTMFGMNRRLRGAAVGHLAAFEMTSSIPCRFVAEGLRRVGFGDEVAEYYDEHVEADAVHEQIAARDLAGALAEDEPELLPDILFGAAACLAVEGWAADDIFEKWKSGDSALRESDVARAIRGGASA